MSSIRSPVKTIVLASGTPSGANSGPSYTFSRQHTITRRNFGTNTINAFFEFFDSGTPAFSYNIGTTSSVKSVGAQVGQEPSGSGGVAFLCPTTLSNITGNINFGYGDVSTAAPIDISLNIYKTDVSNSYISFATGATLLFSSRFAYNPVPAPVGNLVTLRNITVPVNVTSAGLTNNDIVYVSVQFGSSIGITSNARLIMRYTLNFS
jgi:hypothetical protein